MRLLVAALLALSLPAAAEAPAPSAKAPAPSGATARAPLSPREQRVLRLMEVTGAAQLGLQMADAMVAQFEGNPSVPKEFLTRFRKKMDPETLTRLVIPVYVKHLSEADVEAAIRFYETPAGKRVIAAQPQMMQESVALAQQWSMEMLQSVQAEMELEGTPSKGTPSKK